MYIMYCYPKMACLQVITAITNLLTQFEVIEYVWRGTYSGKVPGTNYRAISKTIYVPGLPYLSPCYLVFTLTTSAKGVDICEFNAEGKLKVVRGYLDKFAFLQQVGIIPAPTPKKHKGVEAAL